MVETVYLLMECEPHNRSWVDSIYRTSEEAYKEAELKRYSYDGDAYYYYVEEKEIKE